MHNTRKQDKIYGCLLGGAIGDAWGYPLEFRRDLSTNSPIPFPQPGLISDDTQMTLFTANALLWRETRLAIKGIAMQPMDAIYLGYLDWLGTQTGIYQQHPICWLKDIPELQQRRAPGNTCLSALSSGKRGSLEKPINNSRGCGGIMRIAPLGLYTDDLATAGLTAAQAIALTHGHPLAIMPGYVLSVWLSLLTHINISLKEGLSLSLHLFQDNFGYFSPQDKKDFLELVDKAISLSCQNIPDDAAIAQLGEGWLGDEALAITIYACLRHPNDFQAAIITATHHAGDSDSTGSIAGNIMGAYLGAQALPSSLTDHLELASVITEIANDLSVDKPPVGDDIEHEDEHWLKKYLFVESNQQPDKQATTAIADNKSICNKFTDELGKNIKIVMKS